MNIGYSNRSLVEKLGIKSGWEIAVLNPPKGSSKVPTDLDENGIRRLGLVLGLVDIKVCAVDQIWSGLKFVIRKENRI